MLTQAILGCKGGDISLNGTILTICAFGQWYTLCSNTWTLTQAKVACRQLGRNPIGKIFICMKCLFLNKNKVLTTV